MQEGQSTEASSAEKTKVIAAPPSPRNSSFARAVLHSLHKPVRLLAWSLYDVVLALKNHCCQNQGSGHNLLAHVSCPSQPQEGSKWSQAQNAIPEKEAITQFVEWLDQVSMHPNLSSSMWRLSHSLRSGSLDQAGKHAALKAQARELAG